MLKTNYADYQKHKQEHDNLVLICLDLQKQFHAGKAEITHETTGFVKDWLVNHIPNIDRRYGPRLTAPVSPDALSMRDLVPAQGPRPRAPAPVPMHRRGAIPVPR